MGARPEQQLALNFLRAVNDLWIDHPGKYIVKEEAVDLVPALAQVCIKALATDLRDSSSPARQRGTPVNGCLLNSGRVVRSSDTLESLNLRDVVNKIIHGTPTEVEVRSGEVILHYKNSRPARQNASARQTQFWRGSGEEDAWTDAWFSASEVLKVLEGRLYKHRSSRVAVREAEIQRLLSTLGFERFLQSGSAT